MDVLIYIGKAAVIFSLFYVVYATLLKSDTHFTTNRLFLGSGVLLSFVLPFIQFTKTITVPVPDVDLAAYSEEIPTQLVTTPQQMDWWRIALIIYALVTAILLIRLAKQCYSLSLLLKKHPVTNRDGFKFIITTETVLPFSFFNYIVYNPSLHQAKELAMILKHEKVHVHQKHSFDILLANLLTAFQWANPFAWLYKKSIEENLEFIADNETATLVSSKKEYQVALVKASSTYPIPALTTNFYQSFTKKRIVMLNKKNSKRVNTLKSVTIVPLLALFLWGFNVNETVQYTEAESPLVDAAVQKSKNNISEVKKNNTAASTSNSEAISSEEKKTETSSLSSEKRNMVLQDSVKGFQVIITKNTTVEELEGFKKMLKKEHNASFTYSNLNFNSKGEITGISISYSDARGNNNNYSVSSGQPINDFVLSVSEDGRISSRTVMTEQQKAQREKMLAARDKIISQRKAKMEDVKAQVKERQEEIVVEQKERMEEMKKEMKKRQEEMQTDAKSRMKALQKNRMEVLKKQMEDRKLEIRQHGVSDSSKLTISSDTRYYDNAKNRLTKSNPDNKPL